LPTNMSQQPSTTSGAVAIDFSKAALKAAAAREDYVSEAQQIADTLHRCVALQEALKTLFGIAVEYEKNGGVGRRSGLSTAVSVGDMQSYLAMNTSAPSSVSAKTIALGMNTFFKNTVELHNLEAKGSGRRITIKYMDPDH